MSGKKLKVVNLTKSPLRKKVVELAFRKGFHVEHVKQAGLLKIKDVFAVVIEDVQLNSMSSRTIEQLKQLKNVIVISDKPNASLNVPTSWKVISLNELREKGERVLSQEVPAPKPKEEKRKTARSESGKVRIEKKLILIGSSTGGPGLIEAIAKSLPKDYPHSVIVVQHMPKGFTERFASRLNEVSQISVVEARENLEVRPNQMIIAKSGYHLHFKVNRGKLCCSLVENDMGHFFVPSVDETFFSASRVIENAENIVGIVLTGIGDDGAEGLVELKKRGALTIAESEETAAVYGMPKEAKERGGALKVLPFDSILEEIVKLGET